MWLSDIPTQCLAVETDTSYINCIKRKKKEKKSQRCLHHLLGRTTWKCIVTMSRVAFRIRDLGWQFTAQAMQRIRHYERIFVYFFFSYTGWAWTGSDMMLSTFTTNVSNVKAVLSLEISSWELLITVHPRRLAKY